MATETVVRLSDLVATKFRSFWKDNSFTKILKGGRSSTKSSNVSIRMVKEFLEDDLANHVAFRKVANTLRTSVYEQIKWAIYKLHVEDEFEFLKAPMMIKHKRTGTAFYFYGVDDPLKIKGNTIAIGYVTALWFEEATEFEGEEELDTVTDTFVRELLPDDKFVSIYLTYNPPKNPYHWMNEYVEKMKDDPTTFIHHSDYEDAIQFLSPQLLQKIERIRKTDPDYWEWMYKGKVTGLGNTIYNYSLFNKVAEIPDDDRLILADIAIDSGYSTSATTFLYIGYTVKRRTILLDTYYYSPVNRVRKKAPSEFSKDLNDFVKRNNEQWGLNLDTETIDSAEGALRNQYAKDYGIYLRPAKKKEKEKMIENVEDLLAQGRVYVLDTENNAVFLDEHKRYMWDEKSLKTPKPQVIKVDDHTCDAFQYFVNNNLEKLGLKM